MKQEKQKNKSIWWILWVLLLVSGGVAGYYATHEDAHIVDDITHIVASKGTTISASKKDQKIGLRMTASSSTFSPLGRKENGIKYTDRVDVKKSKGVDTTPMGWTTPSKNFDITYRKDKVLPYQKDRRHDHYLVIPRLGVVVPLIYYEGNPAQIKKEFEKGAVLYPDMAKIGEYGNSLIGGHSSAIIRENSEHYRNAFITLPELDPGDEVRGYSRKNGQRYRYRYEVTESYAGQNDKNGKLKQDIVDVDPSIQEVTLYTCIPIGTDRDRWIIKANMKEERKLDDAIKHKLRMK